MFGASMNMILVEFHDINDGYLTSSITPFPPVVGQTVYFRQVGYRVMSIDYILSASDEGPATPTLKVNMA